MESFSKKLREMDVERLDVERGVVERGRSATRSKAIESIRGRVPNRVGCRFLLLVVDMECSQWTVRVCGGVNDDVAMNRVCSSSFRQNKFEISILLCHASYSRYPH